jgi:N,N'-diacetylbacillosaminyl-diphospho-undecaprenol alpha-1,3-N-acetylgalactosaminyltransferase
MAGKMAKVPTIINLVEGLGSFYIEESVKNRVVRTMIEKLYQIVFTFSDQVVFVNSDDPAYLQSRNCIAPNKINIIKSVGIDTEVFSPDRFDAEQIVALKRELGVEDKLIVLMVARAIWHKGIKEFYEATSFLSEDTNIQFILVGDVDDGNPSSVDRSYLEAGAVLWLGHRDDIASLTAMSDIYVLPSYREGVPRTLLEAASMAKPIITTDTVGCREVVVDGENGYLIPIKDSPALAQKIAYLAAHPQVRKIMGENGRIRAIREFDIKRVVEQYMKMYDRFEGKK